jgi:acetyltransferase-like isoleucine patch superfamily enzyme
VGQGCSFLDLGGITVGDRVMIAPKATLITATRRTAGSTTCGN